MGNSNLQRKYEVKDNRDIRDMGDKLGQVETVGT
jgi:hypothetical protein